MGQIKNIKLHIVTDIKNRKMGDEEDEYSEVVLGGKMKLKGAKIKKKKKKKKNKAGDILEQSAAHCSDRATSSMADDEEDATEKEEIVVAKTKAELAYEKAQEKQAAARILKKASKTHKQRVEELNEYLGDLSEHYDIQKVSWTK